MKKSIFECEVVTPMFLMGANKEKNVELRAPSFKGAMRFWWRAINSKENNNKLNEEESKIFGASSEKIGKSKFILRVEHSKIMHGNTLWDEIPFDTKILAKNKENKQPKEEYKGLSYLLYSVHRISDYPYIKPGTSFKIVLSSNYSNALKEASWSLLFLSFFGAIGKRSRRGAGSFRIKKIITNENLEYNLINLINVNSKEDLKTFIENELKPKISIIKNNTYSTLSGAKIYIFDPENNWKEALKKIGNFYYDFRQKIKKKIELGPNFGFPIVHHNKNNKIIMGAAIKNNNKPRKFKNRRASPLIFKVIKTNENNYFPIITWLNGDFLPNNFQITDKKGKKWAQPNSTVIDDFFKELKDKEEITL
ncbi:MAG: type III-B CRISPR module RAMP protein Cmr1 [Candidatus Lokiarchaeota archaeon]|nr:type III-B CRISPR module RAMP protein Cmr1 [Candidatus Harpocratesius repetitus]